MLTKIQYAQKIKKIIIGFLLKYEYSLLFITSIKKIIADKLTSKSERNGPEIKKGIKKIIDKCEFFFKYLIIYLK